MQNRKHVDQLALTPRAASLLDLPPNDLLVDSAAEIMRTHWHTGNVLLVVGAIGAVTRLVGPLLRTKDKDPAVVVLDAKGMNVVPLLGGHKAGAEKIALHLAEELGGNAVLTGDTRIQSSLPIDSFGEAWGWKRTGDCSDWHQLMLNQASGVALGFQQKSGSQLWINSEGACNSFLDHSRENLKESSFLSIGPSSIDRCCWHPPTLWIGVGCARNTSLSLLYRSFKDALSNAELAIEAIAGLASIDLKSDEEALRAIAESEGWPIRFFSSEELALVSVPTPSKEVELVTGTPSVAEAAALLAAGDDGLLIQKKQIYHSKKDEEGAATIAIAESSQPFSPTRGELNLVGSGPGELAYLTHDARSALARSAVWIGYRRYLDLLEPLRRSDQVRVDGQLTFERERCDKALELAMQGVRVALVSSGDSGIYGMAGLALELWLDKSQIERPAFNIHPGISAIQIAAARCGAPLMNDFCTISLSDRLTPWPTIEQRIRGAASGDFVIAIYNPRSKDREWQLQSAIEIIKEYRSANSPIVLARQIGRAEETIDFYNLKNCPINKVDMLTLIFIGNSQSLLKDGYLFNPRGYLSN